MVAVDPLSSWTAPILGRSNLGNKRAEVRNRPACQVIKEKTESEFSEMPKSCGHAKQDHLSPAPIPPRVSSCTTSSVKPPLNFCSCFDCLPFLLHFHSSSPFPATFHCTPNTPQWGQELGLSRRGWCLKHHCYSIWIYMALFGSLCSVYMETHSSIFFSAAYISYFEIWNE